MRLGIINFIFSQSSVSVWMLLCAVKDIGMKWWAHVFCNGTYGSTTVQSRYGIGFARATLPIQMYADGNNMCWSRDCSINYNAHWIPSCCDAPFAISSLFFVFASRWISGDTNVSFCLFMKKTQLRCRARAVRQCIVSETKIIWI